MPALRSIAANPKSAPKEGWAWSSRGRAEGSVFAPEILSALPGCCWKADVELTRAEFAFLFNVSTRTFDRWVVKYDLPAIRKNGRVIRYKVDAVLAVLATGQNFNEDEGKRLGFEPKELLKLAAVIRPNAGRISTPVPEPADSVFVADTDADRKVISMLRHPVHGDYLRRMAEAIAG